MPKLCLNCIRRIHLLAGRCPYCRDERQGVLGRLLLVIAFFAACWLVYRHEVKQWPFEASKQRVENTHQSVRRGP